MLKKSLRILPLAVVLATATLFGDVQMTPSQTAAAIENKLHSAQIYTHGEVHVTYANGVATLTGTVNNLAAKRAAVQAARKIKGVTQVVDNIRIYAVNVTPQLILEHARKDVVTYYAYTIFDNVNLELRGNTLIVSGEVTQPFKKYDLAKILTDVNGVDRVVNDLKVLPVSSFDDRLRLQIARAIYGNPYFTYYANQAIPPIHIIVDNGNVTLTGVVATKMDREVAMMRARSVGLSFSVKDHLRVEHS